MKFLCTVLSKYNLIAKLSFASESLRTRKIQSGHNKNTNTNRKLKLYKLEILVLASFVFVFRFERFLVVTDGL